MTAMHLPRATKRHRKAIALPASSSYRPGYFTDPVRAWWPMWSPYVLPCDGPRKGRPPGDIGLSQQASAGRRRAQEQGTGWGKGTILMPNTPKNPAPGWIS